MFIYNGTVRIGTALDLITVNTSEPISWKHEQKRIPEKIIWLDENGVDVTSQTFTVTRDEDEITLTKKVEGKKSGVLHVVWYCGTIGEEVLPASTIIIPDEGGGKDKKRNNL